MKKKTCSNCNKKKQADKFYLNKFQLCGLSSLCIKCQTEIKQEESKILRAENHLIHIKKAVEKAKRFIAEYEEVKNNPTDKKLYLVAFDLNHELTKMKFTEAKK